MSKGVKITVNIENVKRKFSDDNLKRARYAMANQMHADMHNYVPFRQGTLRTMSVVATDGKSINYNATYAKAQFYGNFVKRKGFVSDKQRRFFFANKKRLTLRKGYTTAGTGKRWDLKAKSKHMRDWTQVFSRGAGF